MTVNPMTIRLPFMFFSFVFSGVSVPFIFLREGFSVLNVDDNVVMILLLHALLLGKMMPVLKPVQDGGLDWLYYCTSFFHILDLAFGSLWLEKNKYLGVASVH